MVKHPQERVCEERAQLAERQGGRDREPDRVAVADHAPVVFGGEAVGRPERSGASDAGQGRHDLAGIEPALVHPLDHVVPDGPDPGLHEGRGDLQQQRELLVGELVRQGAGRLVGRGGADKPAGQRCLTRWEQGSGEEQDHEAVGRGLAGQRLDGVVAPAGGQLAVVANTLRRCPARLAPSSQPPVRPEWRAPASRWPEAAAPALPDPWPVAPAHSSAARPFLFDSKSRRA